MDYKEILEDIEKREKECSKRFFEAESKARSIIT